MLNPTYVRQKTKPTGGNKPATTATARVQTIAEGNTYFPPVELESKVAVIIEKQDTKNRKRSVVMYTIVAVFASGRCSIHAYPHQALGTNSGHYSYFFTSGGDLQYMHPLPVI